MTRWHECTDPVSSRICTMALLKPQRGVCGLPFMNSITGLRVVSFFSLQAVPSPTHYTLYTSSPQPIHSTQAPITTPLYLGNHHHNQSTTSRQPSQLHYTWAIITTTNPLHPGNHHNSIIPGQSSPQPIHST